MENGRRERRCILFIMAHPDDESFGAAGTACRYAAEGVELALVTATRGGQGSCGAPPVCTPEELPEVRERELRRAADIIGINRLHVFDYEDKNLDAAPPDEIRERLVRVIREHRPQIVVTFDPQGVTGHVDHIAINRFTSDAVSAAADRRYYAEAGAPHIVSRLLWFAPKTPTDVARSPAPESEPGIDFLIDVSEWRHKKIEALRAHRTQNESIDKEFFEPPDAERILSVEIFRSAWNPRPANAPLNDLFDGL